MSTNQGLRQQSIRDITGTAYTYNGDWIALFQYLNQTSTDINGGMVEYLQGQTGLATGDINGLKAAYAADNGFDNWDAVTTINAGFTGILDELAPVLWADPASQYVTLNGADVSAYLSREGSSINYVQTTESQQPTYTGAAINSVQAMDFASAASQELVCDTDDLPVFDIGAGGFYFIAAIQLNDNTDTRQFIWGDGATKLGFYAVQNSAGLPALLLNGASITFPSQTVPSAAGAILEYWRDGTSVRCRLNGVLDTDSRTSAGNTPPISGFKSTIADFKSAGGQKLDGLIGDILLYDDLPSLDGRNSAKSYLAGKYGISV